MTNKRPKFRLSAKFRIAWRKREMASFREARLRLLDSYDDGLIDKDELVMLYDLNTSKNPIFPCENYERFELTDIDEAEWKAEFRFEKSDLPQLAEALRIPQVFKCKQRRVCVCC